MTARYTFGAAASGGIVFGLAWRQLPALAIGVTAGVLAMTRLPTDAGLLAAVVAVAVGGSLALVPVAGHRIDEWIPLWAGWTRDRLVGAHRWRSPAPGRGHTPDGKLATVAPPALAGVEVCAAPLDGGAQLGVVTDDRAGSCAAVVQLSGHGLLLASDGERAGRLAAWGDILAGLARADAPIAGVQWLHRITPDDGTDPTTWATNHQPADAADAVVDSYPQSTD